MNKSYNYGRNEQSSMQILIRFNYIAMKIMKVNRDNKFYGEYLVIRWISDEDQTRSPIMMHRSDGSTSNGCIIIIMMTSYEITI